MNDNTPKRNSIRPVGPNGIVKNSSFTDVNVYKTEHLWVINHYSFQEAEGKELQSSRFTSDFNGSTECTWYIALQFDVVEDFISLYLCLDSSSRCKSVSTKIRFSIMTNEQTEMFSDETWIHKFTISSDEENADDSWGEEKYLKKDVLSSSKHKLLPNDKLTIFCEITYSQVISTCTSHRSNSITFQASAPNNRLLEDFGSLLKNGKFADVTISVNGTEYPVHKTILAARSAVFSAMFEENGMRESVKNRIDVTDIRENVMEEMLRYIYTGKVENLDELAYDLFEAADKYDLAELKAMCENVLSNNLSFDSAAKTLDLADLHHANELKSEAMDYIVMNSSSVMSTEGWKAIVADSRSDLLNEVCQALSRQLAGYCTI